MSQTEESNDNLMNNQECMFCRRVLNGVDNIHQTSIDEVIYIKPENPIVQDLIIFALDYHQKAMTPTIAGLLASAAAEYGLSRHEKYRVTMISMDDGSHAMLHYLPIASNLSYPTNH